MRAVSIIFICGVVTVPAFRTRRTTPSRPAPTPVATENMIMWSGSSRSQVTFREEDGVVRVLKYRPEWSKYERCTAEGCEECNGNQGCWHGEKAYAMMETGPNWLPSWLPNWMTTRNDPVHFVNYTLVAHAKCSPGDTRSMFGVTVHYPYGSYGGSLKMFWGGELVRTVPGDNPNYWARLLPDTPKELRLTWTPTQTISWVKVSIQARFVSEEFTRCQDQEACLERLATEPHLRAGLELREQNHLLKQCLDGNVQSFSTGLAFKCADWLDCLDDEKVGTRKVYMREHFEHVLNAARVDRIEKTSFTEWALDFPGCIDPAIADVFSWECDCYDNAVKQCGIDPKYACMSTTDCLNTMLCKSDKVCPRWKRRTGCDMRRSECESSMSFAELAVNNSDNSEQHAQALLKHANSRVDLRGSSFDETLRHKHTC